jgi:citrate synthase
MKHWQHWQTCGRDLNAWTNHCVDEAEQTVDIWPPEEHLPGFDPNGVSTPTSVVQLLSRLAEIGPFSCLGWLSENRPELEALAGLPLNQAGVAAAALVDLGFTPREGEMLYLILRLPGAAAHALEQEDYGFRNFPFYPVELSDDPGRQVEK